MKMTTQKFFALAFMALLWSCVPCFAQQTLDKKVEQYLKKQATNLNSSEEYAPEGAQIMLGNARFIVVESTLKALDAALKERRDMDRDDSPFHAICDVIGQWRIEEAIPTLLPHIDATLDPRSFRGGARYGIGAYYPVASALIHIKSPDLNRRLFDLLEEPMSEDKLRVVTYVLRESNDKAVAQFLVERNLAEYEKRLTPQQKTSVGKENLLQVLELLKTKDGAGLPLPAAKPKIAAPATN